MIVFWREYTYRPRSRPFASEWTYLEAPDGLSNEDVPLVVTLDEREESEALARLRRERTVASDIASDKRR